MSSPTNANQRCQLARVFDPQRSREELQNWTLEVFQNLSFEDAYHHKQLGYCGIPASEVAVETLLVGLFEEGKDLLNRANTFLRLSLDRREQNELDKGIILERAALLDWLQYRKDDKKTPRAAVSWHENSFDTGRRVPGKAEVQRALPVYLEAQEYEKLITRFESAGLQAPASLSRIRGQGTMAYVIAKQRLSGEYDQPSVNQALKAFLSRSVPKWLGRGHFTTAARWMKIAHWQYIDDPFASLLRCYDYLSGLAPPEYFAVLRGRPAVPAKQALLANSASR